MENYKKETKRDKGNKFPWGYYLLFATLSKAGRWYFNGKSVETEAFKKAKKEGPMLVMCNHASALDFLFFVPPFGLKKTTFVVA